MDLHGTDEGFMERGSGEDWEDVFKEDTGGWKVLVLTERFAEGLAESGIFLGGVAGLIGRIRGESVDG